MGITCASDLNLFPLTNPSHLTEVLCVKSRDGEKEGYGEKERYGWVLILDDDESLSQSVVCVYNSE